MRIIDETKRFKDNSLMNKSIKLRKRILFHWTGSSTAESAINWLDQRINGKGTVGYSYIICKSGLIHMLADPKYSYMQSSGLGRTYDKDTIAIAFVMVDASSKITIEQIDAVKELIEMLNNEFDIFEYKHHAEVNSHKRDFPDWLWKDIKKKLKI